MTSGELIGQGTSPTFDSATHGFGYSHNRRLRNLANTVESLLVKNVRGQQAKDELAEMVSEGLDEYVTSLDR